MHSDMNTRRDFIKKATLAATSDLADCADNELQYDIPRQNWSLAEWVLDFQYVKAITFEFSHFMSPQSAYIQASHLYNRYREYFNL